MYGSDTLAEVCASAKLVLFQCWRVPQNYQNLQRNEAIFIEEPTKMTLSYHRSAYQVLNLYDSNFEEKGYTEIIKILKK